MFPFFAEESSFERHQSEYCRGEFEQCERFKWASIGKKPNPKLLPDGGWLSQELASEDDGQSRLHAHPSPWNIP